MSSLCRQFLVGIFTLGLGCLLGTSAFAHLIVAQHGTLSITKEGVYMVLSLPASAFSGLDDDHNGAVSMVEFNKHRRSIIETVREHVILYEEWETVTLDGIMLSPDLAHDTGPDVLSRIVVMGRFKVSPNASNLRFHVGLYGIKPAGQLLEITATNRIDNRKAVFDLTADEPASLVFSG